MNIRSISLKNYRNIENVQFEPSDGINLIYGENAQGKTNIIEGTWLFTGCKSFRGSKDKELIKFGEDMSVNSVSYTAYGNIQDADIIIKEKRKAVYNGCELSSPVKMMGEFSAVVFSPSHLSLIKNGPSERRKFIDTALCQLKPSFAGFVTEYLRILKQRNSLLKDIPYHSELLDTLDIWDSRLAKAGEEIVKRRKEYTELISQSAGKIYSGLSSGKEDFKCRYISSYDENEESYSECLFRSRKNDILSGSTSAGPHRDDLDILINGISARVFGSQGQQRSCALALKMAEGEILKDETGEYPVILLDDVMSELDENRQDYIFNRIKDKQVFITCCDPESIKRAEKVKSIKISGGNIIKISDI